MVKSCRERDSNSYKLDDLGSHMAITRRVESKYLSSNHGLYDSTLPRLRTRPCAIGLVNECRVGTPICRSLQDTTVWINKKCSHQVKHQNFPPSFHVRNWDDHLSVEPSGPEQSLVQVLGPIRRAQNHDTLVGDKSVHLWQKLRGANSIKLC